ncbi:glutathione S-transferase A [Patella vulgata]|uniref:glutathione S-transferase A n=1 Tax=Patella vulgata TaxID=6465 RepID=UPI0024A7CED9|nr:glutathione S-transferase A [Patella vulgata]
MASNMFLFWGSGSVPCWKPMIALEEKGFGGYPNKLIKFSEKEHKAEDVMKLNPRGQVPTFKDGDIVVNESAAICDYLERRYCNQGTQLIPSDVKEQANVLQRMYEVSNVEGNILKELVYYIFHTKKEDQDEALLKEKYVKGRAELQIWEGYMEKMGSGAFIASKSFSMADVYFFPYLAFFVRLGLNLSKFPALSEYYNRVKDRASVKNSWPPHWAEEPSKADFMSNI